MACCLPGGSQERYTLFISTLDHLGPRPAQGGDVLEAKGELLGVKGKSVLKLLLRMYRVCLFSDLWGGSHRVRGLPVCPGPLGNMSGKPRRRKSAARRPQPGFKRFPREAHQ